LGLRPAAIRRTATSWKVVMASFGSFKAYMCALVALFFVVPNSSFAAGQDIVKVGNNGVVSDAVFYIAEQRGFFTKQNIKIELVKFDAGPQLIAPLGTGQLDVGGGAASAGLINAVARGINIKAVADKGSTPPGYEYFPILVRKDLVDSGTVKTFADFRGLKVAEGGQGGAQGSSLNEALKKGGLTYKDVEHVYMGYPQHVLALVNGSVDFSVTAEPSATQALQTGKVVKFPDQRFYSNQQAAILLFGGDFISKRRDVAMRFMVAYVQAARYYNDALKDGAFAGKNADEVITLLIANTGIKDPAIYRKIVPNGINPDGRLNVESLAKDYAFYREFGYVERQVDLSAIVDSSFVEHAVKVLGPYEPAL
jgi:NitT/TauT family transport system substrate-binding protein